MKYFDEKTIVTLDNGQLLSWLQNEAGVQSGYFGCNNCGNLQLQQVPEEYVNLLDFFRNREIGSYLELGIANGGSFLTNSIFIGEKCKKFHAVDTLQYGELIDQTEDVITEKMDILKDVMPNSECTFFNTTTDEFFEKNTETYDCIFIGADHSYEGVKKDYDNALKCLNEGGILIFQDVGNGQTGVKKCWDEVKGNAVSIQEFVKTSTCGIGVYHT